MTQIFAATTITEIQADQTRLSETIPKQSNTVAETFLLVCFGFAALSAIATFLTKEFHKKKATEVINGRLSKIPCPNCQYFSKSSYLRCAVQPTLTMTNDATDCTDFTPCPKK